MDQREALKIAEKYIGFIKDKYPVEKAYLFGSFAKKSNHFDSNIDIAIVIKNVVDIIDTQIELMKLRCSINMNIEPHPFLTSDF